MIVMASYIVALLLVIEMVITFGYCIREVASGVAVIGFLSFLFVAIFLWREKKLNLLKAKLIKGIYCSDQYKLKI